MPMSQSRSTKKRKKKFIRPQNAIRCLSKVDNKDNSKVVTLIAKVCYSMTKQVMKK